MAHCFHHTGQDAKDCLFILLEDQDCEIIFEEVTLHHALGAAPKSINDLNVNIRRAFVVRFKYNPVYYWGEYPVHWKAESAPNTADTK